jgi:hypothetical protein
VEVVMIRKVEFRVKVSIESDGPCGSPGYITHEEAQRKLKAEIEEDLMGQLVQRDYGTVEVDSCEETVR